MPKGIYPQILQRWDVPAWPCYSDAQTNQTKQSCQVEYTKASPYFNKKATGQCFLTILHGDSFFISIMKTPTPEEEKKVSILVPD